MMSEKFMQYSDDLIKGLHRTMVRIRVCEESLVEPILAGEVRCPCHLYSGQEAIATAVCACLDEDDYMFGTHRSHGHFLAKGGSMRELVAEIYGRETGCSRGRGGSMHLIDPERGMLGAAPIVGGTVSLAVGAALAASIRQEKRISVCFFGDGATGEGVLYESLNLAAVRRLPVLFVCENNLYSTHLSIRECRPSCEIYGIAHPFGIPSFQVDGNDVLAVHDAATRATGLCREGGPAFIECLTYRQRGHVGPNDNLQGTQADIRPKEEIEAWLERDPITRLESYMSETRGHSRESLEKIWREAEDEAEAALEFARRSPLPHPTALMNYVYSKATELQSGD